MRWVDLVWLVVPAFEPEGLALSWMDVVVPLAMGALWLHAFLGQLKGRPLISLQDAGMTGSLEVGAEAHA